MPDGRITKLLPPKWALELSEKTEGRTYADVRRELDQQEDKAFHNLAHLMLPVLTHGFKFDRQILEFAETNNVSVSGPEWRMNALLLMSKLYLQDASKKARGRPKTSSNLLLVGQKKFIAAAQVLRKFNEQPRITSLIKTQGMTQRQACAVVALEGWPGKSSDFIAQQAKNLENKMSMANAILGKRKSGRPKKTSK
jgi:hypothetical protein